MVAARLLGEFGTDQRLVQVSSNSANGQINMCAMQVSHRSTVHFGSLLLPGTSNDATWLLCLNPEFPRPHACYAVLTDWT
jgi:hypothetical protein